MLNMSWEEDMNATEKIAKSIYSVASWLELERQFQRQVVCAGDNDDDDDDDDDNDDGNCSLKWWKCKSRMQMLCSRS